MALDERYPDLFARQKRNLYTRFVTNPMMLESREQEIKHAVAGSKVVIQMRAEAQAQKTLGRSLPPRVRVFLTRFDEVL